MSCAKLKYNIKVICLYIIGGYFCCNTCSSYSETNPGTFRVSQCVVPLQHIFTRGKYVSDTCIRLVINLFICIDYWQLELFALFPLTDTLLVNPETCRAH